MYSFTILCGTFIPYFMKTGHSVWLYLFIYRQTKCWTLKVSIRPLFLPLWVIGIQYKPQQNNSNTDLSCTNSYNRQTTLKLLNISVFTNTIPTVESIRIKLNEYIFAIKQKKCSAKYTVNLSFTKTMLGFSKPTWTF